MPNNDSEVQALIEAQREALEQSRRPTRIELLGELYKAIQLDNHFSRPVHGGDDWGKNVFTDEQFDQISKRYFDLLIAE